MGHPFLKRLTDGPLLADGAMGTMLYARGVPFDQCFDALNTTMPAVVEGIHRDYVAGGAELLETNTFGANRFKLAAHGLEAQVSEVNRTGAALARRAADAAERRIFVAGSMGPVGRPMAPLGTLTGTDVRAAFGEQARALAAGGADVLILETFTDLSELVEAFRGARDAVELPIIAQMTFTQEGKTLLGHAPGMIARTLADLGAAVVGANCSVGPQGMMEVMQLIASSIPGVPLSAMPNAGFPAYVGGRWIYYSSPAYMAEFARRMAALGVSLIGGCCGTTPDHIAAMRDALRESPGSSESSGSSESPTLKFAFSTVPIISAAETSEVVLRRAAAPSRLAQKLRKSFVVTAEVDPPHGAYDRRELDGCRLLRDAGVDAIDVADNPMARLRMSPWAMCARIESEVGLETILHFTTRDRTLVRLQSDLLAVHALGIRNILVLRGDLPQMGDYPVAAAAVKPSGIVKLIKQFNQGHDVAGNSIGAPTAFTVGVALNLSAPDLDKEARILARKIEAGADFVCTMPIYEPDAVDKFARILGGIPIPVLVGVLPLVSARHAEFLHNELPGFAIPEWVRRKMRLAGNGSREVGLQIATELLSAVRSTVAGAYLVPSFGRYDGIAELIQVAKVPVRT
jgi:methionine synthase I (cobalamin-dependent)/5,10-methylenetetrahydrofolate reductase